jgi:hypothetical protein
MLAWDKDNKEWQNSEEVINAQLAILVPDCPNNTHRPLEEAVAEA